ncbi:hypothetical protein KSP40_PGU014014 [Platanthera guangdongensis]|uniref:Uncharacterized protein n=1 Tax=Platanthera guangdongensis TaxID=2320717 RepID=A0ABR2MJU7_9ASPA
MPLHAQNAPQKTIYHAQHTRDIFKERSRAPLAPTGRLLSVPPPMNPGHPPTFLPDAAPALLRLHLCGTPLSLLNGIYFEKVSTSLVKELIIQRLELVDPGFRFLR